MSTVEPAVSSPEREAVWFLGSTSPAARALPAPAARVLPAAVAPALPVEPGPAPSRCGVGWLVGFGRPCGFTPARHRSCGRPHSGPGRSPSSAFAAAVVRPASRRLGTVVLGERPIRRALPSCWSQDARTGPANSDQAKATRLRQYRSWPTSLNAPIFRNLLFRFRRGKPSAQNGMGISASSVEIVTFVAFP